MAAATSLASVAHGQQPPVRLAGQAVLALTHADPVPGGNARTELRIVQPVIMLRATGAGGRVGLLATANFEGATMAGGELAPGTWGEGFMDRRHPHTFAHELMLVIASAPGRWRGSAAFGKGFVPFGTDDPMSRPALRYPVNHHFSQILERAVIQAGVGAGPVTLEVGVFNGDEPERPSQWPNLERLGDSWAARFTVVPLASLETQVSHARVHSPEHRLGAAGDQRKWSVSARWDDTRRYGLIEWARTSELNNFFVFTSLLVEGAAKLGRHHPYARLEQTERPEEQRVLDPFRSQRPHIENAILGITRWSIVTGGYRLSGPASWGGRLRWWPFAELSLARVTLVTGSLFDPDGFYGRSTLWSATLGLRLDAGLVQHRMGRYGVFSPTSHSH